jgi:PAS domain S-box-containing protein
VLRRVIGPVADARQPAARLGSQCIGTARPRPGAQASTMTMPRNTNEQPRQPHEEEPVARAAPHPLWLLSRDLLLTATDSGQITAVNPAWERVLGRSEQELVGVPLFDLVHPEDRERTRAGMQALLAGRVPPTFENRWRHRDGSWRTISWSANWGDGLMFAAGRDMTAVRARAETMREAEAHLRQSQKLEAVGQLTGGIAHDFNNLLTIISTSIQLLQRPQLPEDRRQRFMGSIADAVSRASRLTGQLLAFARRQALQPVVFDASRNIAAMGEMVQTLVGARIALTLTSEGAACWVDADPGQFDTAVVNMAANARDAVDGSGRLVIDTRRVHGIPALRGHPAVPGDFVAVAVTDTGSGLDPARIDRVFEPFYTTKAVGKGTGLGLSQVFGFAQQSGGDVRAHSVPGQGSTFTLYLPLARREAAVDDAPAPPAAAGAMARGRLLVVEDHPEVAAAAEATLVELGYDVTVAASAEAALAMLTHDAGRFRAVFSDVMMAHMDGLTLAREIRRRHPHLPVLLCSGYSSVLAHDSAHGFALLPKPYTLDALVQALDEVIAGSEASRQRDRAAAPQTCAAAAAHAVTAEQARLADLDALQILDTPPQEQFDALTRIAATLFDAPVALISLVDAERQWFKSRIGVEAAETPRAIAFCAHAIERPDQVMVVHDATRDERFADNPMVLQAPRIRFYAGAPLVTSWGHAIGTICVVDTVPRKADARRLEALKLLAREVVERMEADRVRGDSEPAST